ncbi:MAG: D-tyrosyl-tRNA(Tyr) deacylase [Lachnospiraceae bacterium]|nr:D-tyrosyl-tRNA(Tyr) deacylase [Lachnospiraceae bacterium]
MRLLIQRVQYANVTVKDETIGSIKKGFLVFIGISNTDTKEVADKMLRKLLNLRLFEDENGKTNLDINQVDGEVLLVSQFTLYADCKKGNRPSFIKAGTPNEANELYQYMIEQCTKELPNKTACGSFGADMKISLLNDGPFTVMLDSDEIFT